ncbi:MAG: hypothetical protein GX657_12635 [Chloroflexi bacterium]|nr:hypothetical protein [Chloroflexota bacterium]
MSTDAGETWRTILVTVGVTQVHLSPSFPVDRTVYVRMEDGDLWRSTDGGASWTDLAPGLLRASGNCVYEVDILALGAAHAIFAATYWGLIVSLDCGSTWYLLSESIFSRIAVAFDPGQGVVLYAMAGLPGASGPLVASSDLGETWETTVPGYMAEVQVSPFSPEQGDTVYLRRSEARLPEQAPRELWVREPSSPGWRMRARSLPIISCWNRMVVSPTYEADGTAFIPGGVRYSSLLRTADGGRQWAEIRLPGISTFGLRSLVAFSPRYSADRTMVATLDPDAGFVSTDAGQTWMRLGTPLPTSPLESPPGLLFAPDGSLYVGGNDGLFRSRDLGATWQRLSGGGDRIVELYLLPLDGDSYALYINRNGWHLQRSVDCGATWTTVFKTSEDDWVSFAAPPLDSQILFALYSGVRRTVDGGATWDLLRPTSEPPLGWFTSVALSPAFAGDRTMIASSNASQSLTISRDAGDSWQPLALVPVRAPSDSIAWSPRFAQDGTLYACCAEDGPRVSEDGGRSWFPLPGSFGTREGGPGCLGPAVGLRAGQPLPLLLTDEAVFVYRRPTLLPTASTVRVGLPEDSSDPVHSVIPLAAVDTQGLPRWTLSESVDWLSPQNAWGTLEQPPVLVVDPTKWPAGAKAEVTLTVYWSYRDRQAVRVSVQPFIARGQVQVPLVASGWCGLGTQAPAYGAVAPQAASPVGLEHALLRGPFTRPHD